MPKSKDEIVCINCGKEARWCDSEPDEDGDMHDCDHIACDHCLMSYTLVWNEESHQADSFEAMKDVMRKIYRGFM